jgi:hypothetical protein
MTITVDRSHLTVGMFIVVRAVLGLVLWHREGGFFWLSGDDASRSETAFLWSQQPFFNLPVGDVAHYVWPPLPIWINSLVLRAIADPVAVSSTLNMLFSLATIPLVYGITAKLFPDKRFAPVIAAAIPAFTPLVIWLGLSGLSEPIFHFFLLLGVFFWVAAVRDNRPALYLPSAVGFLGASMCRLEGWLFVTLFCVSCLISSRARRDRLVLLSSVVVASAFIPAWLWWHWAHFGDPFAFVRVYKATSPTAGFDEYFGLLWRNSPVAIGLAFFGIAAALRRDAVVTRYLVLVGAFFLAFASTSTIAQNLPARNLTSVLWLLAPLSAYGITLLLEHLRVVGIGSVAVAAAWLAVGTVQAFDYHLQASKSVRKLAVWSRQTIQSSAFRKGDGRMLIELRRGGLGEQDVVWDSLFVHAVNPDILLYDRRPVWKVENTSQWTLQEAGNPTILSGSPDEVREALRSRRIEFVIAYSDAARSVLEAIMKPVDDARTSTDDPSAALPPDAAVAASRAWIRATPNPVPLGPGMGSTTVSWATGDPEGGHVYVSLDGEKGRLFATGASGSQEAPWIGAGTAYEFQLYSSRNTLLSAVTVERRGREYRVYTWPPLVSDR